MPALCSNSLKFDFLTTSFLYPVVTLASKHRSSMAPISGHEVPLMPLGPSAENDVPLVYVRTYFLNFELRQMIIIVGTGLPTQYVHIKSTTVYAPRRNWDSPNPFLASECSPPPPETGGRGHTSLPVGSWGKSQFQRGA